MEQTQNNMSEDKLGRQPNREEDSEPNKIIKAEDPDWRPIKYRVEDGKKIIILGNFEMTAEEFMAMARTSLSQTEREEVEQRRCETFPSETLQRIE